MTRRNRRDRKLPPVPAARTLPAPQPLRLPNGYYDPDSAAFDARGLNEASEFGELMRTTTPVQVGRPVRS